MKKLKILLSKYASLLRATFYSRRLPNAFKSLLSYMFRRPKAWGLPPIVQIEPTTNCNLKCALCLTGRGQLKRLKGDMSFDFFKEIINQLEDIIIYLVMYNLGEPLLNKEIFKMIEYAKMKKIFIRLSTNGAFLSKQDIENLVRFKVDEVIISLDCANSEIYEKYKGSDGFKKVIENTGLLIKQRGDNLKPFVDLQVLAMRGIERDIIHFKELARNLGVDRALIKKLRVNFPGIPSDESFLPKNSRYVRKAYRKKTYKSNNCYKLWLSTLILWDGVVVPCCFDMEGHYSLGSILQVELKQIWNSDKYKLFRKNASKGAGKTSLCKDCSLGCLSGDLSLL
ncbi:MAG: radical SAM protein [Candidatus Omnitrophica bacterium]|nr:radical SAM protein [Candidatus Omnitrophota bacterium]